MNAVCPGGARSEHSVDPTRVVTLEGTDETTQDVSDLGSISVVAHCRLVFTGGARELSTTPLGVCVGWVACVFWFGRGNGKTRVESSRLSLGVTKGCCLMDPSTY